MRWVWSVSYTHLDILHTSSLREFTYLLGREIYETLLPRSRKMATDVYKRQAVNTQVGLADMYWKIVVAACLFKPYTPVSYTHLPRC